MVLAFVSSKGRNASRRATSGCCLRGNLIELTSHLPLLWSSPHVDGNVQVIACCVIATHNINSEPNVNQPLINIVIRPDIEAFHAKSLLNLTK